MSSSSHRLASTLDPRTRFGGQIKIIQDDDYDSKEDYDQDATQEVPNKYIVELKEAEQDQIDNVMQTVNVTTTTSIYDFQGKSTRVLLVFNQANETKRIQNDQ